MLNKKIHNKTELRDQINLILNDHSFKNPLTESQIIISHSANKSNYIDVKFEDIDFQMIEHIVSQRITGKPLSKIIKQKGFWKDIFYTDENTLDPRSDSEILIESIIQDFNSLKNSNFEFIDLCCGTGCLGISLLREFKSSTCDFIDISRQALLNCKKNIYDLAVDNRSNLYESDLFENYPISKIKNIKLIICNPPYFTNGPQTQNVARATARHTVQLSFIELLNAIAQLLHSHGTASLIIPTQSWSQFQQALAQAPLHICEYVDVSSVEGKPANRLLLAVKHGKALLPIVNRQMHIRNKQGHYSAQMIDFCRDFYLKL